jgi:hypothetical protein
MGPPFKSYIENEVIKTKKEERERESVCV